METPINRRSRARHVPTPKMSERKRNLFSQSEDSSCLTALGIDEDSDLGPITPLQMSSSPQDTRYTFEPENLSSRLRSKDRTTFKDILNELSPGRHNSMENCGKKAERNPQLALEPTEKTPSVQMTLNVAQPKISFRKTVSKKNQSLHVNETPPSVKENEYPKVSLKKLNHVESPKARTSLSFEGFISTKSFYSKPQQSDDEAVKSKLPLHNSISLPELRPKSRDRARSNNRQSTASASLGGVQKGVWHKIRKPRKTKKKSDQRSKVSKWSSLEIKIQLARIKALNKAKVDKTDGDREDTMISMQQIERMNKILSKMKNPIHLVRPLTTVVTTTTPEPEERSSFFDSIEDDEAPADPVEKRFFKTQRKRPEKMRAIVINGKISFVRETDLNLSTRSHDFEADDVDLSIEHHEIDDIINRLSSSSAATTPAASQEEKTQTADDDPTSQFMSRIPYNTSDATKIQEQRDVLDFLAVNNILTEENFKIFIAEPEKYVEEASQILEVFVVVKEDEGEPEDVIPPSPTVPLSPTSQISSMTSELALDEISEAPLSQKSRISCASSANSDTDAAELNLYPVFRKGAMKHKLGDDSPVAGSRPKTRRLWNPIGNQYQIDAGQTEYGARECTECGLLYSIHEPEDEIVHEKFHKSMQILNFRGWNQENVVAKVPEWGVDGRIIAVCSTDTKFKLNRVAEIMEVVDADLGFVCIPLDPKSIVYMAICRGRVMGVCVATPKLIANRFIEQTAGGLDCVSKEQFPIRCGIVKIWVGSPYRRQGVATYLINTVRSHFIFGHYLSFDELAFSSPTDAGKALVKKLSNRSDFLVYLK